MMTFMGIEEIYYIEDPADKENAIQQFRDNCNNLRLMIKRESGLEKLEKLFTTITKAKHQSEMIDYYRKTKERYDKDGRK